MARWTRVGVTALLNVLLDKPLQPFSVFMLLATSGAKASGYFLFITA